MSGESPRGLLDRAVEQIARWMDDLGLNGARLRWKWNRRAQTLGEAKAQGEQWTRSVKTKHKMCPECRALVERNLNVCPVCGESLSRVARPGMARAVSNLFPGIRSATPLILLVNGFWFVLMLMAQIKKGAPMGLFGMDLEVLARFGMGIDRPLQLPDQTVTGGEWWRYVTPIFLHGGLLHFGFNSMVLMQLGQIVESIYGSARFWVIYVACGLAGTYASLQLRFPVTDQPTMTVGASGALMGLLGLLVVYSLRHRSVLGDLKRTLFQFGAYMLVLSVLFNLDHWNHAGGFLMGVLLSFLVPPPTQARQRLPESAWPGLAVAAVLLVLAAFYSVATFSR